MAVNKKNRQLIGQILLKTGLIEERTLKEALIIQKSQGLPIGEILSKDFSVSGEHIKESLKFQHYQEDVGIVLLKDKLGQVLKNLNIIESKDIKSVLAEQKRTKKLFGQILSEKSLIRNQLIDDVVRASEGDSQVIDKLSNKKLGELLVDLHYLENKNLEQVLSEQKYSQNKKLGEMLIEKGLLAYKKLRKALNIQKKLSTLTAVTLVSAIALAGCSTPRVPMQSLTGTVENYHSSVIRVLNDTNPAGTVNYYQDGTIAITNVPFFRQGHDNTCGQAVMASILNFWGVNVPYQTIVNQTNAGNLPTDVWKITDYFKKYGLYAQDYRLATLDFVKVRIQNGQPVIMLLDFGTVSTEHYVIATGYNENTQEMIILDPIDGPNVKLPYTQVEKMWENRSLKGLGIFGDKYNRIVFDVKNPFLENQKLGF